MVTRARVTGNRATTAALATADSASGGRQLQRDGDESRRKRRTRLHQCTRQLAEPSARGRDPNRQQGQPGGASWRLSLTKDQPGQVRSARHPGRGLRGAGRSRTGPERTTRWRCSGAARKCRPGGGGELPEWVADRPDNGRWSGAHSSEEAAGPHSPPAPRPQQTEVGTSGRRRQSRSRNPHSLQGRVRRTEGLICLGRQGW